MAASDQAQVTESLSEGELAKRAHDGDLDASAELFSRHYDRVQKVLLGMRAKIKRPEVIEEVATEAFLKAVLAYNPALVNEGVRYPFLALMVRIARNRLIDEGRKQRDTTELVEDLWEDGPLPDIYVSATEVRSLAREAIAKAFGWNLWSVFEYWLQAIEVGQRPQWKEFVADFRFSVPGTTPFVNGEAGTGRCPVRHEVHRLMLASNLVRVRWVVHHEPSEAEAAGTWANRLVTQTWGAVSLKGASSRQRVSMATQADGGPLRAHVELVQGATLKPDRARLMRDRMLDWLREVLRDADSRHAVATRR